jgi:hypothetical protein
MVIQKQRVQEIPASQLRPQRPLFRAKAIQHYARGQEKDILPRLVSPPFFICSWILLCLLTLALLLAWWGEVPVYATGSGIVFSQQQSTASHNPILLIFLPATYAAHVHPGLVAEVQIGETGPQFTCTVASVQPGVLSPDDVRQYYRLDPLAAQIITQPALAVILLPKISLPMQQYAGSLLKAQVHIGSQRILSLLPGFNQVIGE